jgi:hypothetical protein
LDSARPFKRLALAVGPCGDIGVDGIVVEVNNINADATIEGLPDRGIFELCGVA